VVADDKKPNDALIPIATQTDYALHQHCRTEEGMNRALQIPPRKRTAGLAIASAEFHSCKSVFHPLTQNT